MKSKCLLLVLSLALLLIVTTTAEAQFDNIRNVYFDTLVTGDVAATPIGVGDMSYIGTDYITQSDSTLMAYATAVVRNDIDFYADFELVFVDSFYLKTYEISELDVLGWQRLGATYLLRLEAEFPAENMRVRWRLWDVAGRQQFARGTLARPKEQWRELGHDIANDVVYNLTGDPGIFLTQIVYAKQNAKGKELFLSDYDGANERQLTNNGSINLSPSFSPLGNEVFFVSYKDGDPSLFVINLENNHLTKVASFEGSIVAAPAVSPDGRQIACVLSKDGNSEIYALRTDGKIIKRLTYHRSIDTSPTWSPDSRRIAFASDRSGAPQVYIMDADGLNTVRLTYKGSYNDSPIWSDRGDRITFVTRTKLGRFDLASIDTSGTDFRVLTEVGHNENPHFSPDGKHIIFTSTDRITPHPELFTMDITGRNQRRLTRSQGTSSPDWGPLR
ncbi:MAG: Tol-Pal system beta propeller repeat protein TolB [bacterium]